MGRDPSPQVARERPDRRASGNSATGSVTLVRYWLHLQCGALDGCLRAVVLTRDSERDPFKLIAAWPNDTTTASALRNAATAAIRARRTTLVPGGSKPEYGPEAGDIVACPMLRDGAAVGAAVFEFAKGSRPRGREAAATLQTGAIALARMLVTEETQPDPHARRILDIVAASVEHVAFDAASRSATSRIAAMGRYEQVTLGLVRRGRISVCAASGRASVDPRLQVARNMGMAMDESIAQDATLIFPCDSKDRDRALGAHAELAARRGVGAICTIPINHDGMLVGAILLEHADDRHFDAATTAFCETAVALIGPILYDKYLRDRRLSEKLASAAGTASKGLLAPDKHWRGIVATIVACVLTIPFVVSGQYRVTADASLEGSIRRIVTSPVDGFISRAPARAGDVVEQGQLLAQLDDRDMDLERLKWSSEKNQLRREYREAMAEHDSTRVTILKARLDRATAQLALAEERIMRARISAPMAGIVVAGDMSQSLGAPVEKGQNLYEIAPLDAYRVMLEVDERDVGQLTAGQMGRLALVGLPERQMAFRLERITPIAKQAEGRNFFIAEARLEENLSLLRPGMDGIGKIEVGERRLIWIWTHRLVAWLRLQTWAWLG